MRERGLKFNDIWSNGNCVSRSREGAWIEINPRSKARLMLLGRSREGAWIEISYSACMALNSAGSLP